MKRKISFALVAISAIGIAAVNVLNSGQDKSENTLRLANIIALSEENDGEGEGGGDGESGEWGCNGNPTLIPYETLRPKACQIWGANGTLLICTEETKKVCCDPSKQTDCKPLKL